MLKILSLGAGVQSSTLLWMSALGVLPKLDCAIFADTGWEPSGVYTYLDVIQAAVEKAGIPIYRVSAGNIREDLMHASASPRGRVKDGERNASIPFFTKDADGKSGILKRQCTSEYKIGPIEKKMRELLGLKPRARWPKDPAVELWMGISGEELRRVRISDARWKTHRYPLVYDLERVFTRHDCKIWLQSQGLIEPPRSSCIGCPFHTNAEWKAIKDREWAPEEWASAVEFDEAIRRKGGVRGDLFLHRSCQPLVQIDFSTPEDRGQGAFDFTSECLGYCGT